MFVLSYTHSQTLHISLLNTKLHNYRTLPFSTLHSCSVCSSHSQHFSFFTLLVFSLLLAFTHLQHFSFFTFSLSHSLGCNTSFHIHFVTFFNSSHLSHSPSLHCNHLHTLYPTIVHSYNYCSVSSFLTFYSTTEHYFPPISCLSCCLTSV